MEKVPRSVGPYSIAITAGVFVFVSGTISMDLFTAKPLKGDIEFQTKNTLENIKLILESCGSSIDDVVKKTVFLKDFNNYLGMNKVYRHACIKKENL